MFDFAQVGDLVGIAYYNAEQAYYGQSDGVTFLLHVFWMQGEQWTRRVEVRFTLPSRDPEYQLRLFVSVILPSPDAAAGP